MDTYKRLIAGAILGTAPQVVGAQGPDLIPALERLAESGDAEAIYHLGMAYQTGSGVKQGIHSATTIGRKFVSRARAIRRLA